jgi:choline dehydrogenase-like flavoprotein
MLHFNGIESDFENWAKAGAYDWDYQKMKYFLNRHENLECEESCPCPQNSTESPKLKITDLKSEDLTLCDAFLEAGDELNRDNKSVNFRLARYTVANGKRHSVYHEYLRRAFQHPNLHILMNSQVLKIEFNGRNEATSVLVSMAGKVSRIFVKKEVILSAGAIQSPQILKLSGIGDPTELTPIGIDLVHDSPRVGENLFDHLNFPLFISVNESGASVTLRKILSPSEIYRYFSRGEGVWSNPAVVGLGSSGDNGVILFGIGSVDEKTFMQIANFKREVSLSSQCSKFQISKIFLFRFFVHSSHTISIQAMKASFS